MSGPRDRRGNFLLPLLAESPLNFRNCHNCSPSMSPGSFVVTNLGLSIDLNLINVSSLHLVFAHLGCIYPAGTYDQGSFWILLLRTGTTEIVTYTRACLPMPVISLPHRADWVNGDNISLKAVFIRSYPRPEDTRHLPQPSEIHSIIDHYKLIFRPTFIPSSTFYKIQESLVTSCYVLDLTQDNGRRYVMRIIWWVGPGSSYDQREFLPGLVTFSDAQKSGLDPFGFLLTVEPQGDIPRIRLVLGLKRETIFRYSQNPQELLHKIATIRTHTFALWTGQYHREIDVVLWTEDKVVSIVGTLVNYLQTARQQRNYIQSLVNQITFRAFAHPHTFIDWKWFTLGHLRPGYFIIFDSIKDSFWY